MDLLLNLHRFKGSNTVCRIVKDTANGQSASKQHYPYLRAPARRNQQPLVQQFWEVYEYLDTGDITPLNHSSDNTLIAISLNHFYEVAERHSQRLPPITEMKHLLKNGKRHAYVDQRVVNSAIFFTDEYRRSSKSLRCWVFKRENV